jgi:hypothetical protein
MKVLAYAAIREPMTFKLPPGSYYVGDPCYVLEKRYDELMDLKWGSRLPPFPKFDLNKPPTTEELKAAIDEWQKMDDGDGTYHIDYDGKQMLVLPTIHGDGVYDFTVDGKEHYAPVRGLCVDSGQLAFIDVRLMEKEDKGGRLVLHEETEFHKDERSNVTSPVCTLLCDPDSEEDEGYDYGDEDDEADQD